MQSDTGPVYYLPIMSKPTYAEARAQLPRAIAYGNTYPPVGRATAATAENGHGTLEHHQFPWELIVEPYPILIVDKETV